MKQLVIFDLDGTLLNTIADLGTATNYALRQSGYPEHSLSSYPMFVGNGVTRLIERAMPEDMRTPENIQAVRENSVNITTNISPTTLSPTPVSPNFCTTSMIWE